MNKKTKSSIKKNKEQVLLKLIDSSENSIFTPEYVRWGKNRIYYTEVLSISFNSSKLSSIFIPISQNYYFNIYSEDDSFEISFTSLFNINKKQEEEKWFKLIEIYDYYIKPLLLNKFLNEIFVKNKSITIGNIIFDNKGYHKSKFFGGINSVLWGDTIYEPQFKDGEVILFKQQGNKGVFFGQISMKELNAVIIPDLIFACAGTFRGDR